MNITCWDGSWYQDFSRAPWVILSISYNWEPVDSVLQISHLLASVSTWTLILWRWRQRPPHPTYTPSLRTRGFHPHLTFGLILSVIMYVAMTQPSLHSNTPRVDPRLQKSFRVFCPSQDCTDSPHMKTHTVWGSFFPKLCLFSKHPLSSGDIAIQQPRWRARGNPLPPPQLNPVHPSPVEQASMWCSFN